MVEDDRVGSESVAQTVLTYIYVCCDSARFVGWLSRLNHHSSMSTRAKATLAASCAISAFIIWGVHYQQTKERDVCIIFYLLNTCSYGT